ncbi:MAG: hypothetical protein PHI79_07140 [Sulfurovaceae bacterium]|nr:hypothetical protein [Sulfurovaceae bacterium]MDD5549352.1 hypothetical protein [Sulfurovaceae bacterium]
MKEVKSKYDIAIYTILAILFVVPLVTTESMIASCELCQVLIKSMSAIIPGIGVMSSVSQLPQTVAFEISLVWVLVPLIVLLWILQSNWIFSNDSRAKIITFLSIMLLNEFWIGLYLESSFFHGTIAFPKKSHLGNLAYKAIQNDIGIGVFAILEISYISFIASLFISEVYKILQSSNKQEE